MHLGQCGILSAARSDMHARKNGLVLHADDLNNAEVPCEVLYTRHTALREFQT